MRLLRIGAMAALVALCASLAPAQTTTTVTGTIKDLTSTAVTSGYVTFTLQPAVDTTISGSARFTPQTVTCNLNASGQVISTGGGACVVTNNASILPSGTYYRVGICPYAACSSEFNWYALGGSQDISTVVPTPATSPNYTIASPNLASFIFANLVQDGITDDTTALQAAITNAATGSWIWIRPSPNCAVVSNIVIDKPIHLMGAGGTGSCLTPKAGTTGYLLTVTKGAVLDNEGFVPGVEIGEMYLDGNHRQAGLGCLKLDTVHGARVHDMVIKSCRKEAIDWYTSVRESSFENITERFNGDKDAGIPANNFVEQVANTAADPHNGNKVSNIWSDYEYGDHFVLDTAAGNTNLVRDNSLSNIFIHGLVAGADMGGNTAPTTGQTNSLAGVKIGSAQYTELNSAVAISTGTSQTFIDQWAGTNATGPSHTMVRGWRTRGRYNDPASDGTHICIHLEAGDMSVEQVDLDGCNDFGVKTEFATFLRYGASNILPGNGPLSIAGVVGPILADTFNTRIGFNLGTSQLVAPMQYASDLAFGANFPFIAGNCYPVGVNWKYMTTRPCGIMEFDYIQEGWQFYIAPSGTAGTQATLTVGPLIGLDGGIHTGSGISANTVKASIVTAGAGGGAGTTITNTGIQNELAPPIVIFNALAADVAKIATGQSGTFAGTCASNTSFNSSYTITVLDTTRFAIFKTGSEPTGCGGTDTPGTVTIASSSGPPSTFSSGAQLLKTTYAALPTCDAAHEGEHAWITDATANTWGTAVTGGNTNHAGVACDGTSWKVYAQ